jgi:methionyl aminopeptidase
VSYGPIETKSRREVEAMREAGQHVAEILLILRALAKPGVSTAELGRVAKKEIDKRGLKSSFLGYSPAGLPPYPAVVCLSVNEEVVHGIPGSRELEEGDILSVDFGVECGGFHGDSAATIAIGKISDEARTLIETTHASLDDAVEQMVPGNRLSDIGYAVQKRAEGAGFSVVRQFVGHGIGRQMHEPPQVPNYGRPGRGPRLMAGMVFAVEPMVNVGGHAVRVLDDEWTAVTADGALSAHFEHTILISDDGPDVLTRIGGSH